MLAINLYGWSGKLTLSHNIQPNIIVFLFSPNFAPAALKMNMLLKTQENIANFSKKVMQYPKITYKTHDCIMTK